jgi:hypothetical protein
MINLEGNHLLDVLLGRGGLWASRAGLVLPRPLLLPSLDVILDHPQRNSRDLSDVSRLGPILVADDDSNSLVHIADRKLIHARLLRSA